MVLYVTVVQLAYLHGTVTAVQLAYLHGTVTVVQLAYLHGAVTVVQLAYLHGAVTVVQSLNALVQSAGFSMKTQPRLLLLPISSHGLTTATVSAWVHLILSSNLSRKFRTLLQDLFFWHPVTTTQHFSWKNCTGFPFQNVLSIKSLVCVSVL